MDARYDVLHYAPHVVDGATVRQLQGIFAVPTGACCEVGQGTVWEGISLEHSLHDHIPNQTESGFWGLGMSGVRLYGLVVC